MAREHDISAFSHSVRNFIDAEAARRGLSDRLGLVRRQLLEDIESDMEADDSEDQLALPMPPEGDPNYHPAIHGARSPEHLMQLIEEGFNSGVGEPYSRAVMDEIIAHARKQA